MSDLPTNDQNPNAQNRHLAPTPTPSAATEVGALRPRLPEWLKVKMPGGPRYMELKQLMRGYRLHTVCEEARCPNIGECWERSAATFMILGTFAPGPVVTAPSQRDARRGWTCWSRCVWPKQSR